MANPAGDFQEVAKALDKRKTDHGKYDAIRRSTSGPGSKY